MPDIILAIDQGTTGTTVMLIDRQLQVIARGYTEIKQHYPQPGWVEHDPVGYLELGSHRHGCGA